MKQYFARMTDNEIMSFVNKFRQLLSNGKMANLEMNCESGCARVNLEVIFQPSHCHQPQEQQQPCRQAQVLRRSVPGPARQRRHLRRAQAREAAVQAATVQVRLPPNSVDKDANHHLPQTVQEPVPHHQPPQTVQEPDPHHQPPHIVQEPVPHNQPPHIVQGHVPYHQPPHTVQEPVPHHQPPHTVQEPVPHHQPTHTVQEDVPQHQPPHTVEAVPNHHPPHTMPPPCPESTTMPPPCPESTTMPPPCPESTTMPPPCTLSLTMAPPCPLSDTRPSDQADSPQLYQAGAEEMCSFSFHTLCVPSPPSHHPHSSRRAYLLSENYVRPSFRNLMKPVVKWRPTDMNNVERACHRKAPWDDTLRLGIMGIPFELCDVYL